MLFSSLTFLYRFLPLMLLLCWLIPQRWRNLMLLGASLIFYGWGEPSFLPVMVCAVAGSWLLGCLMERYPDRSNLWLVMGVGCGLGLLVWFKYVGFLSENLFQLTGGRVPVLEIALPIGISFYTFQLISYLIDVHRGRVKAQRDPISLGAYIAMFPQLIAGPIVRYEAVEGQLRERHFDQQALYEGTRRFLIGLGKKVLLANRLYEMLQSCQSGGEQTMLLSWLYAVGFTLQIYFDFSGYSDMAIGLGRMLGFVFPENFDYPYTSASVTEFWRRWHMTLGGWFRDYVYIPLGGNRVGRGKWLRNILVVWLLTGLWHGAAWNFILWGLFYGVILLVEKLWLLPRLKDMRVWNHIYTMLIVIVGFVLFDSVELEQFAETIKGMAGLGEGIADPFSIFVLKEQWVLLVISLIGTTRLPKLFMKRWEQTKMGAAVMTVAEPMLLAVLLITVTAELVDGSFNPFLYFRF